MRSAPAISTGAGVARLAPRWTRTTTTSAIELSWKHSGDSWLNEVQLTYEDAFYVPHDHQRGRRTARCTRGRDGAGPEHHRRRRRRSARRPEQGPEGLGASATPSRSPDIAWGAGDHTIKAGVKYKDVDLTAADSIPGNPRVLLRRDRGGHRDRSRGRPCSRCRSRASTPTVTSERQAVRPVRAGRLDGQRPPDAEPRHPLGHREEPVVPRLRDAAVPARFAQHGDRSARASPTARRSACPPIRMSASTSTTTSAPATTAIHTRTPSSRASASRTTSAATSDT